MAIIKKSNRSDRGRKNTPISVRGMRDLIGVEYLQFQGFFEKAAEVALYYGFTPIDTPIVEQEEVFVRTAGESSDIVEKELYAFRTRGGDRLALRPEATAPIVRAYIEHGMQSVPQPVYLYTFGTFYRHGKPQRGRYRELRQFDLEILGTEKSIADAIIIYVTLAILKEIGLENISLEINSIGDKDCRPAFRRELAAYYRKHLSELCKDCHRRLKDNPLRLLDCKICSAFRDGAPTSISFLCEACKRHFKEVLEYLEALDIVYSVNSALVRGLDYYTRTVFEIFIPSPVASAQSVEVKEVDETKDQKEKVSVPAPLAISSGGRYDYLAKELGNNKPVPGVGVGMGVDRILELAGITDLVPRIIKKPKVFFVQLGFEAKLKSLSVVEILRQAKVPVMHSLSKDGLSGQLATAEKLKIPYTMILGQKEVIEDSIIVRDMSNRSQKSIPLSRLADYAKKLK